MTAPASPHNPGTIDLVEQVVSDARELLRLEVNLAKTELSHELSAVRSSAIFGVAAFALGLTSLSALIIALGLAFGPSDALGAALFLMASAGVSGLLGYRRFPKKLMVATGVRLRGDEAVLKGHLS
jgi:uncharacterized membrane protein YqjE